MLRGRHLGDTVIRGKGIGLGLGNDFFHRVGSSVVGGDVNILRDREVELGDSG